MAEEITTQIEPQESEAEKNAREAFAKLAEAESAGGPEETKQDETANPETKPEEKAEVKKDETKPAVVPPDADDDLKDLPEDKPTPDHWKEMRKRYKELKAKVKEPAKAPETETVDSGILPEPEPILTMPQKPSEPQSQAKHIEPEAVFSVLARVAAGELDASYKAEAEKYITDEMTPQEIAEVYRKAQAGYFGENSEVVKEACKGFLPIAQQQFAIREKQNVRMAQAQNLRAKSWKAAFDAVPQLQDKTSEQFKHFSEANAELTRQFPDLWTRPEAPVILMKYAEITGKARKSADVEKELAILKAENADLKKKVSQQAAPIDTGGGQPAKTKKSPEDVLRENLIAAGITP